MTIFYSRILFIALIITSFSAQGQCDFKSKIASDGNLYYYIRPENFYWTKTKSLSGGIVTDKEYYYLLMLPKPFPVKNEGRKLKEDLQVRLANDSLYNLEFYYVDYDRNDTVMEMMYLIDKKDLNDFVRLEITQVMINMGGEEQVRTYNLKLHKNALQDQLNCFLEEKKSTKKKEE